MARSPQPLDPFTRSTLRDLLLPPDGYELEQALGTAYSLDAETLVTIPLFTAGLGAEELQQPVGIARIYELGSRLTLLVQGDRINISRRWARSRPLLGLLGEAVVPASIASGSFHPKLFVLEYVSLDDPRETYIRVVIATRNLTVDNSWDSVVVLDEDPRGVKVPGLAAAVRSLADFVNDPSHAARARCVGVAERLERTKFQPLRGLDELEVSIFSPGTPNADALRRKLTGDELLVISPFVRSTVLDQLAKQVGRGVTDRWLVTRPVAVPDSAFSNYQVFQIAEAVVPTHTAMPLADEEGAEEETAGPTSGRLVGLHAKVYVASTRGGQSRVVVTSANATPSGWGRNVEVAITGVSRARAMQVTAMLAPGSAADEECNFRDLLDELTPDAVLPEPPEPDWVTNARRILAGAVVNGTVSSGPPRTLAIEVQLSAPLTAWGEDLDVMVHPFGYPKYREPANSTEQGISAGLTIDANIELTPFLSLSLTQPGEPSLELVLAMKLTGDLDWGREDARKTLARAAKPRLMQELLWYFGVKGRGTSIKKGSPHKTPRGPDVVGAMHLPVLESILLRINGPDPAREIERIDGLLAGVEHDPEYARLMEMWRLVRGSVK